MKELADQSIKPKPVPGYVWRGMLMGIAEVVPGVSGGTMAFVTGIYQELISTLAKFGTQSVPMLVRPGIFYTAHNLRFLLSLGIGMLLGILLFAQLMQYLLGNYQPVVWAFFSGVIAMSVIVIGRLRPPRVLLVWAPLGLLSGASLLWLPMDAGQAGLLEIFAGSALAVCAWLLPAVSGSFVLLALGLYDQVIHAIAALEWSVLLTVAAGCASGLLVFAKLLAWLLRRYREALLSFLTGFMFGSIAKLWPWQDTAGGLLSPEGFASLYAVNAQVLAAASMFLTGAFVLWLLTKLADE
jgi:putative membrane protein